MTRTTLVNLNDEFVQHDVHSDDGLLQLVVIQVVLLSDLTAEDLGVDTASQTVRTASLEELLGERGVVHVEDFHAQLVSLLLQAQAGVVSTGRPGTDPDVRLGSAQLGESLDEILQGGRLQRDLDEAEGFSSLTDPLGNVVGGVELGQDLQEVLGRVHWSEQGQVQVQVGQIIPVRWKGGEN